MNTRKPVFLWTCLCPKVLTQTCHRKTSELRSSAEHFLRSGSIFLAFTKPGLVRQTLRSTGNNNNTETSWNKLCTTSSGLRARSVEAVRPASVSATPLWCTCAGLSGQRRFVKHFTSCRWHISCCQSSFNYWTRSVTFLSFGFYSHTHALSIKSDPKSVVHHHILSACETEACGEKGREPVNCVAVV